MSNVGPESSGEHEITKETAMARIDAGKQRIREVRAKSKAEAQVVVDELNASIKGKRLLVSGTIAVVYKGWTITHDESGRPEYHPIENVERMRRRTVSNARADNVRFHIGEGQWTEESRPHWIAERVVTDDFTGECSGPLTDLSWQEIIEDQPQDEGDPEE